MKKFVCDNCGKEIADGEEHCILKLQPVTIDCGGGV